jgi:hypothetical protein
VEGACRPLSHPEIGPLSPRQPAVVPQAVPLPAPPPASVCPAAPPALALSCPPYAPGWPPPGIVLAPDARGYCLPLPLL